MQQQSGTYPVTKWAAMLKFSTSGYYDWLKNREERDNKQKEYEAAIMDIFIDSDKTYGPDRVCGVLRRKGYTAKETQTLLKQLEFQQSFSRAGKPGDKPWNESFFSILKKETVHWRHFQTREEVRQTIFKYIEGFL